MSTDILTPWSIVLSEKLTDRQLLKKFPAFYKTRKFIITFTTARHLSLFWATSIQSMPYQPTSRSSILILSFHLRLSLPSGLLPSGFPTKTLYTPLFSPIALHTLFTSVFLNWSPNQIKVTKLSVHGVSFRNTPICMLTVKFHFKKNCRKNVIYLSSHLGHCF